MSKPPEPSWFPRFAVAAVESALADTRIVVVEGARQVGKSTLVERFLSNRACTIYARRTRSKSTSS